ncbi:MAG: MAPEG family protein [Maricaulaceae bacterium]
MTLFEIVALYVAINSVLLIALSLRVGMVRMKKDISLGDGGHSKLQARIRAQGNYIEYTPIALIGLLIIAALNAAPLALHFFGATFLIGRLCHAAAMETENAMGKGRPIGMVLTFLTLLGQAAYILFLIFT